jgi:hypothetical protein
MPDLAQAIWNTARRPAPTGVATPVFTATVLAVGPPLRIQADADGVQLEAVAVTGYTAAATQHVLALRAGPAIYVMRIP